MNTYLILLRGINVGGKNLIPMARLRKCLEEQGFSNVASYIASGNVLLKSDKNAKDVQVQIEQALPENFKLDDRFIKVLVLTLDQLQIIIENKPEGFGDQPEKYHCDVIFLMGIDSALSINAFDPRAGVDQVWAGSGVIYSQRLSSQLTKSHLNKLIETPLYKSMTIRNWNTTYRLYEMLKEMEKDN